MYVLICRHSCIDYVHIVDVYIHIHTHTFTHMVVLYLDHFISFVFEWGNFKGEKAVWALDYSSMHMHYTHTTAHTTAHTLAL